jgi:hypothetical protein
LPTPHLKVEQIALGKLLDAKGAGGKFQMDLSSLFGDKFVVESLEFQDVTIAPEAMPRALQWVDAKNRGSGLEIEKITLKNVKLTVPGVAIELFDADLQFDKQGALTRATARGGGGKWNVDIAPVPSAVQGDDVVGPAAPKMWTVDFSARGIALPIGTPIPVSSFTAKGTLIGNELLFPQFDAQLLEGSIVGSLNASWKDGVKFNSNFTAQKIRVNQLAEVFTRDVALTGKMGGYSPSQIFSAISRSWMVQSATRIWCRQCAHQKAADVAGSRSSPSSSDNCGWRMVYCISKK